MLTRIEQNLLSREQYLRHELGDILFSFWRTAENMYRPKEDMSTEELQLFYAQLQRARECPFTEVCKSQHPLPWDTRPGSVFVAKGCLDDLAKTLAKADDALLRALILYAPNQQFADALLFIMAEWPITVGGAHGNKAATRHQQAAKG
jgi:hypothetical protein